ncbi:MAG TPA: DUF3309 family protein [Candidatus Binatia bacterium]
MSLARSSCPGGSTMYYGYGIGGIVLLIVLILLLTGRI